MKRNLETVEASTPTKNRRSSLKVLLGFCVGVPLLGLGVDIGNKKQPNSASAAPNQTTTMTINQSREAIAKATEKKDNLKEYHADENGDIHIGE